MAKVKVTTRWKILEFVDRFADDTLAKDIGDTIVETAKQMISEGQSPVEGYGRFEKYSDAYQKAIRSKKNPGLGVGKTVRPINLYLQGDLMEAYDYRVTADKSVEVGVIGGSKKTREIAGYHNEGTPTMPQRRIVPGDGENFAITIMRKIRDLYGAQIEKIIRQTNKKS